MPLTSVIRHDVLMLFVLCESLPYSKSNWTDDDSSEEGKVSDEVGDQRTHVGVETEVIDKVEA